MELNKLTELEFESTLAAGMVDITDDAEPVLDFWPYLDRLFATELSRPNVNDYHIEHIYRDAANRYHHILINLGSDRRYLVLVLNVRQRTIVGHTLTERSRYFK